MSDSDPNRDYESLNIEEALEFEDSEDALRRKILKQKHSWRPWVFGGVCLIIISFYLSFFHLIYCAIHGGVGALISADKSHASPFLILAGMLIFTPTVLTVLLMSAFLAHKDDKEDPELPIMQATNKILEAIKN